MDLIVNAKSDFYRGGYRTWGPKGIQSSCRMVQSESRNQWLTSHSTEKYEHEIFPGISAITPRVARLLGAGRGLVCLDPDIAAYHAPNADRDNVTLEVRYSQLTAELEKRRAGVVREMELAVEKSLGRKNERRRSLAKPPLKDYFRDFALLQEVTKAACREGNYHAS